MLYEPPAQNNSDSFEDEMAENESMATHGGVDKKAKASSGQPMDLSLLTTQMIRCCVCGVMTPPNASN